MEEEGGGEAEGCGWYLLCLRDWAAAAATAAAARHYPTKPLRLLLLACQ
jgi:hypothetical protein